MKSPTKARVVYIVSLVALCGTLAAAPGPPLSVSPGAASTLERVEPRCPTFSWAPPGGAGYLQLVVFALPEGSAAIDLEASTTPVLEVRLPGGAAAWTPPLGSCLERGGRYAWSIRAEGSGRPGSWAAPRFFQIDAGPSLAEVEAALDTLRRFRERAGARGELGPPARRPPVAAASAAGGAIAGPAELGGPPAAELDVDGTAEADVLRLGDTGANGIFWTLQEQANNDMTIDYFGEAVRITAAGSVGVNAPVPSATLDVGGTIHSTGAISSGSSITIDGTSDVITASGGTLGFGDDNLTTTGSATVGGFQLTSGAGDGLVLTSNASGVGSWQAPAADGDWAVEGSHLSSAVAGNVGIGTTGAPAQKLQVVGTAQADTLRLGDTGNNGIFWDVAEDGTQDLVFTYAVERLRLRSNGRLDIGALAPASATDLCINAQNELASCSSSVRYKEDIRDLETGAVLVDRLRPVEFKWRDREEWDLGFVAEEVAEIEPLLVTHLDGRLEGVKYRQLTAVLVKALQEQARRIEELERRLDGGQAVAR